jgi:hypothetical protein
MANKPIDGTERPGRFKQIRMVAAMLHQADRRALPLVALSAIGTIVVFVVVGIVLGLAAYLIPLGVMLGVLVGLIVFGQLAQRAQYRLAEGQMGAAASVLENMRGNWTVTPAVAGNRSMDMVHRAVGRPGVVLVSEGPSSRVGALLGSEKKRIARAAHEVPIYDIQVGNEEGQIPLGKLQSHVMKLPRNLDKAQVAELNDRLRALPAGMQMPKGPMPKNIRMPKGPKPSTR